ncbi:hypothetical protein O6H91_07G011500 [Diphasiastrum complanatum]|nr:hypothetical protein O6H91_07G011500 [Diphasiastrum complanatum]
MREAIAAVVSLHGPCPFQPFGAVFVDHTLSQEGVKICAGANHEISDPTLHGEVAAIRNCVAKHGQPRIGSFFKNLSLYSTAEPCPMCMSALRWAGVREVIFATTTPRLSEFGWGMIEIRAEEVNAKSVNVRDPVPYLLGEILTNETDQFFTWQFDKSGKCPAGCARDAKTSNLCVKKAVSSM